MKALWRILTSLKTCAWAGLGFCLAGAAGSVLLGRRPDLFGDMDAQVLAGWFARKGLAAPVPTLWLYGLLLATAVLAVNAFCCTVERLAQILRGKASLRRLLPHVMHLAFLGVVLSHLVSGLYGDRIPQVAILEQGAAPVGHTGFVLALDRFEAVMGQEGFPRDFSATVTLFEGASPVARGVVRANEPMFHGGYGFHVKDFGSTPWGASYVVFAANRDPGALPILASSAAFTLANLLYLVPARREDG